MEVVEIKRAKINGEDVFFPIDYSLDIHNGLIDEIINIEVENFNLQLNIGMDKNFKQICNYNDLKELLGGINLSIFNLENLSL